MLKWLQRTFSVGPQVVVVGDAAISASVEQAARSKGYSTARVNDTAALKPTDITKAIVFAGSDEASDIEKVRSLAKSLGGTTREIVLAAVCRSQQALTALQDLDSESTSGFRVRPLAPLAQTVRRLLVEHHFNRLRHEDGAEQPVVVGTGPAAEQLVIQLFRMMHLPGVMPSVRVVAPDANAWVDALLRRIPALREIGTISASVSLGDAKSSVVYVTDAAGWTSAFALSELAQIFWLPGAGPGMPSNAITVPEFPLEALIDELFFDSVDAQARAIHRLYLAERHEAGDAMNSRPSMRAWEELPERFRAASRHQADHIGYKLSAIGCHSVPAQAGTRFSFTQAELETLAAVEHQRWAAVQWLDGWTRGEVRDDKTKRTPLLVPYETLTQEIKDLDRLSVRAIPAQTEAAGRSILRDLNIGLALPDREGNHRAFEKGFAELLKQIAARYPDRFMAVHTFLSTSLARAAAQSALARLQTSLSVGTRSGEALTKGAELVANAERVYVGATAAIFPKLELIVHMQGCEIDPTNAECRTVEIDDSGAVTDAPWL